MSRARTTEPVQQGDSPAIGGMSDQVEEVGRRGSPARPPARDRGTDAGGTGFSAEAVPLRPAAERSREGEREERLRLLTARRTPHLPGTGRQRIVAAAAVGLALLLVGGALAIGRSGGHGSPAPAKTAAGGSALRHDIAKALARPTGTPPTAAATLRPRRHRASPERRPNHIRPSPPRPASRPPARRPAAGAPVTTSVPVEEPVATPVTESATPAEPAPARAPAPGSTPSVEAASATSVHTGESSSAQEASTLEGQFGFER
jgi:hypothetical protein